MSLATAEKAVRFAHENSSRMVDISFFGGEPLLEKELILKTVDYSNFFRKTNDISIPVRYYVTTNGLLLDKDFLTKAKQLNINIALSLDGFEHGHDVTRTLPDGSGSFSHISKNFPYILEYFPMLDILMTFTPKNLAFLSKGVEQLYRIGFRVFMIGPNYEEPWTNSDLELLDSEYKIISEFYYQKFVEGSYVYISTMDGKIAAHTRPNCEICSCCDKNDGEIAVAPSGNLYPCLRFVKADEEHDLVIGHLDSGINKKQRAKIMLEAGKEWQACRECGLRGRCFHYCSAVNYKVTGKFNSPPSVLCRQEQIAISFADEIGAKLYKEKNPLFLKRFYS